MANQPMKTIKGNHKKYSIQKKERIEAKEIKAIKIENSKITDKWHVSMNTLNLKVPY